MFNDLGKELKYQIKSGGFWVQTILINILIFIIVNISNSYYEFSNQHSITHINPVLTYLSLSSEIKFNFIHPWVWFTHIFTHQSVFHILWNMINLFWFGMIVEDLIGKRHAITIIFEAGILGGVFFLLSTMFFPWYEHQMLIAYGASSSVMGLLLAAACISPNYELRLMFIGHVAIKYIALGFIIIDFLFLGQISNSGGHAAHLGGAFLGYIYIFLLRKGISLSPSDWINNYKKSKFKSTKKTTSRPIKSSIGVDQFFPEDNDLKLNRILEKIKNNGLQSLTEHEKIFLEQLSNK